MFVRRVFLDPRQHALAILQELGKLRVASLKILRVGHETEGMTAVAAVGGPLLQLLRVERSLSAVDGRAPEAGRLAGDGVRALRVGQVVVECQPQARTGPCRTPR